LAFNFSLLEGSAWVGGAGSVLDSETPGFETYQEPWPAYRSGEGGVKGPKRVVSEKFMTKSPPVAPGMTMYEPGCR